MKKMLGTLLTVVATTFSISAWSDPRIDFYPTGLQFRTSLVDEFSDRLEQHAYVYVENGGNVMGGVRDILGVQIRGTTYSAYFYGPSGSLGQATHPGERGFLFARIPERTLRHCDRVAVTIDTNGRLQFGPGVRSNDAKILTAYEIGKSVLLCRVIVDPRLPLPRFPRL